MDKQVEFLVKGNSLKSSLPMPILGKRFENESHNQNNG